MMGAVFMQNVFERVDNFTGGPIMPLFMSEASDHE